MTTFQLVFIKKIKKWVLRTTTERADILFEELKVDARKKAIEYCRNYGKTKPCSLRIHDKWGKFQEERTYPRGADPKRSKG